MNKIIWKNTSIDGVRITSNTYEIRMLDKQATVVAVTPYICIRFMNNTKAYVNSGLLWRDAGDMWQLVKFNSNIVELQLIIGGAYEDTIFN